MHPTGVPTFKKSFWALVEVDKSKVFRYRAKFGKCIFPSYSITLIKSFRLTAFWFLIGKRFLILTWLPEWFVCCFIVFETFFCPLQFGVKNIPRTLICWVLLTPLRLRFTILFLLRWIRHILVFDSRIMQPFSCL